MRPLGHFDAFQIEQFDIGAARFRNRHTVLINRHARLGGGCARVRGDAAHHKARIVRRLVLHEEARHEARKLFELLNAKILQELAVIGGQRKGNLDRILRAQLGRDNNLAKIGRAILTAIGDLVSKRLTRTERQGRRPRQQHCLGGQNTHAVPFRNERGRQLNSVRVTTKTMRIPQYNSDFSDRLRLIRIPANLARRT